MFSEFPQRSDKVLRARHSRPAPSGRAAYRKKRPALLQAGLACIWRSIAHPNQHASFSVIAEVTVALFPRRVNRLAHQIFGISSRPGPELLYAPSVHLGCVEIPFLIGGDPVHAPEASRKIAPSAPGI